jgi:hypothetical protein
MSKNKAKAWNTKYGLRRVRQEDATIEEALAAAECMSDDRETQIELASQLMGLPQEEIRAALRKRAPVRKPIAVKSITLASGPAARPRMVVVETKRPRRAALAQR